MKRPWQVWLALAACSAVVAAAMGWLTVHALRADRERTLAQSAADMEQRVSLALWRMDTKLAPLIAEESARPHFYYTPIITVATSPTKGGPSVEQIASPLLTGQNSSVVLNFNAEANGQWSSPQAPAPEQVSFACANGMTTDQIDFNWGNLKKLASSIDVAELLRQLPEQAVPGTEESAANHGANQGANQSLAAADGTEGVSQGQSENLATPYYANSGGPMFDAPNAPPEGVQQNLPDAANQQAVQVPVVKGKGSQPAQGQLGQYDDLGSRAYRFQEQVGQEYQKQQRENLFRQYKSEPAGGAAVESITRPLWVGDRLLLARRVVRNGATMVQGSWLDWPRIKADLLAETADLAPGADLQAVRPGEEADPRRMLAGLPVRLIAAELPAATNGAASPLHWALGVGWASIVLALVAVAGLLWGVLALSERRAAFVSSVTHELRTPLTTFRMYAEMLVRDMVPTPERRREYLETLRTEAERLTHLVDNVLAYARLERGRKPRRVERTTPTALVERFETRLAERAAQSAMTLECTVDPAAASATLLTDVGVVEQILFNLVDNAAKYAARATDRRIHLAATLNGRYVTLAVRDHGPGFASVSAAERSAPFSKSAEEAAESAPGVGLGLALCRRLAKELGGRLEISAPNGSNAGAAVSLNLPVEA